MCGRSPSTQTTTIKVKIAAMLSLVSCELDLDLLPVHSDEYDNNNQEDNGDHYSCNSTTAKF